MGRIKGIPIVLIDKQVIGNDSFGHPKTVDVEIVVENVLIAPATTEDITNQINLTGKKVVYTLAIPKGDVHNWTNKEVRFLGQRWRTVGEPLEGLEHLIPLGWNKKVQVERNG
ncbi:hypothetical protein [Streptococcus suis]|uniref:Phage protein n=1 Tax=Streptococcus suis TaxID=1307 RepID=A0A9X4MR32_STRSU|nr:hypothetical protein [Streptococcus suis]MBY5024590.1 hypothetical protein [Streptococcus suis]MDG4525873.1 hypothetical protein [Streptococcus suis]MDG4528259.1 hypothetical protein [Streptococcus suis]QZT17239.1 hypothetical protein K6974_11815 [Streptococcus suis]